MKPSFLIFIDGPMGSGKTTTSKLVNTHFPGTARVAFPDIKRLVPNFKENADTIPIIKDVMAAMIETYLKNGVSVIVEQISTAEGIEKLKNIADEHRALFFAYRMKAPKEVRWQRVKERTRQMMGVAQLPKSKIKELEGYFEPNHTFYEHNEYPLSIEIDSQANSPTEILNIIKAKLS